MNIILLKATDFISTSSVQLNDCRSQHIQKTLKSKVGDTLEIGLLNHSLGQGTISTIDKSGVTLEIDLNKPAPTPLALTLILALPRPQMLKRILQNAAEFGIKHIHLIHSQKVEKSFWQTPNLQAGTIQSYLELGLSQTKDVILPTVYQHKQFKPFVEDVLPQLMQNKQAFIAHPYSTASIPAASHEERLIIIGPEGGFSDYEVALIQNQGVQAFSMGERIYKVENAVTLLAAKLSLN